jgi:hypothetical protein
MSERSAYATVVAYLPLPSTRPRLGILADLRGVVAMARRRHPQLAQGQVVDVGIRQEGDRVKAVVKFAVER